MNCRKRKRAERLAILSEIERLKTDLCKQCTTHASSQENNSLCKCPAATRIRELGELLIQTTPRNLDIDIPEIIETELTVEGYKKLKQSGIVDQHIAKHFGIGKSSFSRWKKKNDLLRFNTKHRGWAESIRQ